MGKYISFGAAIEALRTIFDDPDKEQLTTLEIFQQVGRDLSQMEQNKKWLTNRLTDLKHYGLVRPIYTRETPKVLDGVQLTPEGKKALTASSSPEPNKEITLESIAQDIKEFVKQNPSVKIDFTATVRTEINWSYG